MNIEEYFAQLQELAEKEKRRIDLHKKPKFKD